MVVKLTSNRLQAAARSAAGPLMEPDPDISISKFISLAPHRAYFFGYDGSMISAQQLRELALAMPDTEEKSHFEQPDFRVHGKIFAGLSRDGKEGSLKLPAEVQAMVIDANPSGFSPAPGAWGMHGWTKVYLANVELAEVRELLAESYRLIAAKPARAKKNASAAPRKVARAKPRKSAASKGRG